MALMSAIAMGALVAGTGAALDMGGATKLKHSYQDMADAAVLAAARSRVKEHAPMHKIAKAAVQAINDTGTTPTVTTTFSDDKKFIQVDVEGTYRNRFMQYFGKTNARVSTFAETVIEMTENAEIVLVLDTTRSMNYENRMPSLKRAANSFIDIMESVDVDDRIRISVVPFGQYVNVGLSQRAEPWLEVPADWVETFPPRCRTERGPRTGRTCTPGVTRPRPAQPARPPQAAVPPTYGTCTDDGVSYRCQTSPGRSARPGRPARPADPGGKPTQNCKNTYGPSVKTCTPVSPKRHVWNGCVGSRQNAANVDVDYSNGEAKVPGFLNLQCGDDILALTNDFGAVRRKVNGLSTRGETYSAAGLIWGHRMVDYQAPFPLPARSARTDTRRIVIFMTDGFNTRSRNGTRHDGTDRHQADRTSEMVCDGMRADAGLEVYTVSFKVQDQQARRLIKRCATTQEMYYEAANATKLTETFEDIAFSLLTPRLTQ